MQTKLADFIRNTPQGRDADEILRKCVHCGFCLATCPTYQLLGDELDSPRGRIYLIKQMMEGAEVTAKTQLHLDRCLTCRSCETTCPSGVQYGRLVDIGRELVNGRVRRSAAENLKRVMLREALPRRWLFAPAVKLGQLARPLLPAALGAKVPAATGTRGNWPRAGRPRTMLALAGCVQPTLAPSINSAAARVLDRLGISLIEADTAGCCGALRFHLDDERGGREDAKRNIDAWWPYIEQGAQAIVMTASGCGTMVREYGHLFKEDPDYADRAARASLLTRDISEVLAAEKDKIVPMLEAARPEERVKLAFHAPCSLQHGQKIRDVVEELLEAAGYELTPVADGHMCCGSAGAYSILNSEIGFELRDRKIAALCAGMPGGIATANIGCLTHLQSGTALPVRHWIELIDARMSQAQ
jgi:glycolate oxidase iron-sulfur subunit